MWPIVCLLGASACARGSEAELQGTETPDLGDSPSGQTSWVEAAPGAGSSPDGPRPTRTGPPTPPQQRDEPRARGEFSAMIVGFHGALDYDQSLAVVRRNQAGLENCHLAWLDGNPDEGGRLLLSLLVSANGRVKNTMVDKNELRDPLLLRCVQDELQAWTFPSNDKQFESIVALTLLFDFDAELP